MMEDRLNNSLLNIGYQRLNSNAQGIYLFYRVADNSLSIVSLIHAENGNEITSEQYAHILAQIKDNFMKSYPYRIQLLSLVLTRYPDRVKHFCETTGQDSHWIIDLSVNRLMIYETQANDFAGLKDMIEQILAEEQSQYQQQASMGEPHSGYPNAGRTRHSQITDNLPFTVVNTTIIVLNIIVYMITHFTSAFGGQTQMYFKGALSWYYVIDKKEYYRILTSMFMHADWSHIFNNMLVLLFVGGNLERVTGKLRYFLIYFGSGIIAGIASIGYNMWKENAVFSLANSTFSIGASGAIFGTVGAILFLVIANRGRLENFSTVQMILFVALSLYSGIVNSHIDQAAHIGGFLGGLLLAAILYRSMGNRSANNSGYR